MKRILYCLIFTCLIALCFTLQSPTAEAASYSYKINNGQVTITDCNTSYSGSINIPNTIEGYPVTSISNYAFHSCDSLTSIFISKSITSIGDGAFIGCDALYAIHVELGNPTYSSEDGVLFNKSKTVLIIYPSGKNGAYEIPNTVTSIGDKAFRDCDSLTSITIPNSVTSIGDNAFLGCGSLSTVTIGSGIKSIDDHVFDSCPLTEINVAPGNPTYTSDNGVLFNKDQTRLIRYPSDKSGSYTIPNSVTSIGDSAFSGCVALPSITIPNSVAYIGDSAFLGCGSLTSITIPNSVTSIREKAFYYCDSLTSITIPNSVTSIGDSAFSGCVALPSITIPNSVTSIGGRAFESCSKLTSVTIPNSVTSIGDHAFYRCTSLASIFISKSVTSIGDHAFSDCKSLTDINVALDSPTFTSDNGILFNKDKTQLIRYPIGKSITTYTIPNSVTSISDNAFSDCGSLIIIAIPNSVTSIGKNVFAGCSHITDVYYGGSQADRSKIFGDKNLSSAIWHYNLTSIVFTPDKPTYVVGENVIINVDIDITIYDIFIKIPGGTRLKALVKDGKLEFTPPASGKYELTVYKSGANLLYTNFSTYITVKPSATTSTPTTLPTTAKPTTAKPTTAPTTAKPTTAKPTTAPTTANPTTAKPTTAPTTAKPTTAKPTTAPATTKPTMAPTTAIPSTASTTKPSTAIVITPNKPTYVIGDKVIINIDIDITIYEIWIIFPDGTKQKAPVNDGKVEFFPSFGGRYEVQVVNPSTNIIVNKTDITVAPSASTSKPTTAPTAKPTTKVTTKATTKATTKPTVKPTTKPTTAIVITPNQPTYVMGDKVIINIDIDITIHRIWIILPDGTREKVTVDGPSYTMTPTTDGTYHVLVESIEDEQTLKDISFTVVEQSTASSTAPTTAPTQTPSTQGSQNQGAQPINNSILLIVIICAVILLIVILFLVIRKKSKKE